MSTPTVLSDIPALREVSGGGKYGVLFRTGDADDLAAKLIELIHDPDRRARLGSTSRQWASAQFSIQKHIASLLELYNSLVL